MVPNLANRLLNFLSSRPDEIWSGDAFVSMSHFQTSRDLVEEWIAHGRAPLSAYTRFEGIIEVNGYRRPTLNCRRLENFPNDAAFVRFVERKAGKLCGPYGDKEEEAKIASMGGKARLNRIFDLMG